MDRLPHDFYHRAEYHLLAEQRGEGTARLAVYGDIHRFVAWPYLLLPLSSVEGLESTDLCDVTSVYGYPGPVCLNSDGSGSFLNEAMSAIQELWIVQRAVSIFTRTNPLLGLSLLQNFGTLLPAGQTISVNLSIPLEESAAQIRRGHRYEIQRGRNAGLVFWHDRQWSRLKEFILLYTEAMGRKGAESRYFFEEPYFAKLREISGLATSHLLLVLRGQEVAAGAVFTECRGIVQYHLSAMREEHRRLGPVKILLEGARAWAKSRGNTVLHLGGGHAGAADSLFQFKAGFSRCRHQFFVWRAVLDRASYDLLAEARARHCTQHQLVSSCPYFFPQYRQPLEVPEQVCQRGA